jgi:hypothetical protein
MQHIEISDDNFQRLQKVAIPLVDTLNSVITKLIDSYETNNSNYNNNINKIGNNYEKFEPDKIPPLLHTKLMSARFNDLVPEKTNWDSLVRLALKQVFDKYKNTGELYRLSGANVVDGQKNDEGYKFVSSHNFSYQGVSAEEAAKIVVRCAKALGCKTFFEFEWRNKDAAYRPGKRGAVAL